MNQGYETALKTRPEVKQALLAIESRKVTNAYSKNQLRPRLDLTGGYGLAGLGARSIVENPDGTTDQLNYSDALSQIGRRDYPAWSVGVVFAVPIGNRAARGNAAIANADLELARTNFAITKANLQVEVRAAAREHRHRRIAACRRPRRPGSSPSATSTPRRRSTRTA